MERPLFIGVAGGTASGKKTLCDSIIQSLGGWRVTVLSLNSFRRSLTAQEHANIAEVNFDEPEAFDVALLIDCLDALGELRCVEVPMYDFERNRYDPVRRLHVEPTDIVVVEGALVLHFPAILRRLSMRLFVEADDDVRLARRVQRDVIERGLEANSVISQYTRFVKPAFNAYVRPSKLNADVIIPWREDNPVALNLIVENLKSKLPQHGLARAYPNLHLMPSTKQTRGMHTVIRSCSASREDFVFYADRLIRLVVEHALGLLPFTDKPVTTPAGELYPGVGFAQHLCGVSIIRSGEAMENALRECCAGIRIGKLLLVGPERSDLAFEVLPHDVADREVLLMDPILDNGTSAQSAVEYLIRRRNVDEGKIVLLSLLAAPEGVRRLCSAYPRLKLVTSEIDEAMGAGNTVRPGIGDFGNRYFGTGSDCEEHSQLSQLGPADTKASQASSSTRDCSTPPSTRPESAASAGP